MAHHIRHRLPKLRETGDGTMRVLMRDFTVGLSLLSLPFTGLTLSIFITVRRGFRTDGASIPRQAWAVLGHPFDCVRIVASLAHDALYATRLLPRILADFVYYLALRQYSRAPRLYAFGEYLALRRFGKGAWKEKTPESITANRQLVRVKWKVKGKA